MINVSPLTIELIERRPQTAVKVLADMDASDVAAFFEALPTRYAVALISMISAWSAAALISEMTPVSGAAILSELDYQTSASIMRVLPAASQKELLLALPKKLSGDLKSTLTYPDDTVGAKMATSVVIMTANQTVGEAFAELRQIKRTKTGVAYVVDDKRKLLGVVTADELFRLSNERLLGDVMETSVAPISARARLSTIRSLPAWDDYAHLPVVNRQKILVGALARRTLRQKTAEGPILATQPQSQSILSSIASAFISSSVGLAQVLVDFDVSIETTTGDKS
ncbi:magnesium transporter MgtE N-terminal domain-containing protein [Maritalea sp.]|uniref:magnesium transporter MgtE N-terminal domain-containing protein n=1 Tax=Maritalea sp. TaxID=2003361 RepID=UPI003EFB006A